MGVSCLEDAINKENGAKKSHKISAIACPVGVILFVASSCFTIVPTGFTRGRITLVQVSNQAVGSGFTLKKPFVEKIELVKNKLQDHTFEGQF